VRLFPTVVLVGSMIWLAGCGSSSPPRNNPPSPDAAAGVTPDAASSGSSSADGPIAASPDAPATPGSSTHDAAPGAPDGGTPPAGADGGMPVDAVATGPDAAEPPLPAPLEACPTPSIDRLTMWLNWSSPDKHSILIKQGDAYQAMGQFTGVWNEIVVYLQNSMERKVDLTASKGFWLTYSATASFYAELRPAPPRYTGAKKHVVALPSTGGQLVTRFFSFEASAWTIIPAFGAPDYAFADALKEAVSFDFTGPTANTLVFKGLRLDGVVPPCN
jgi:hypothetical protein